ncbi:MAG: hypothetical protein QXW94_05045, partial [Desulfurococcaceae archaeon]
ACDSLVLGEVGYYLTPRNGVIGILIDVVYNGGVSSKVGYIFVVEPFVEVYTSTPAPDALSAVHLNFTVRLWGRNPLSMVSWPLFHMFSLFGEGGRWYQMRCFKTAMRNFPTAQSAFTATDLWGYVEAAGVGAKIEEIYSRPRFDIVDWRRGLVKITADGPVYGFAFYLQRGGKWVKVLEASGSCVLVNASKIFPWDPLRVVPLVAQHFFVTRQTGGAEVWRPQDRLLFKLWADDVGYPKGAPSALEPVEVLPDGTKLYYKQC